MTVSEEYVKAVMERLEPLGEIAGRAMFGGYGIFLRGMMFAVIDEDVLYFKVDDTNRGGYEQAGTARFPHGISYWEVPADVYEDNDAVLAWAGKSINIALKAAEKKGQKRKK